MGIYDRDYNRGYREPGGFDFGGAMTLTTRIVLVMALVYVVQLATRGAADPDDGRFSDFFSLHADVLKRPWLYFQFLTYGFLHDPWNFQHILFNMIGFWLFGRMIEYRYGQREYLAFFLTSIVISGLVWVFGELIANRGLAAHMQMMGASGGVSAVLLLFCLNYPRQLIYIWGVFPIPAWVFAIVFVGMDLMGASGHVSGDANVAFTAHLGGALFALLYFQAGWRLERLVPTSLSLASLRPKPRLRVIDPDMPEPSTEERVDEILKKIQDHGRDSLTAEERRILEEASQKYQRRRR